MKISLKFTPVSVLKDQYPSKEKKKKKTRIVYVCMCMCMPAMASSFVGLAI